MTAEFLSNQELLVEEPAAATRLPLLGDDSSNNKQQDEHEEEEEKNETGRRRTLTTSTTTNTGIHTGATNSTATNSAHHAPIRRLSAAGLPLDSCEEGMINMNAFFDDDFVQLLCDCDDHQLLGQDNLFLPPSTSTNTYNNNNNVNDAANRHESPRSDSESVLPGTVPGTVPATLAPVSRSMIANNSVTNDTTATTTITTSISPVSSNEPSAVSVGALLPTTKNNSMSGTKRSRDVSEEDYSSDDTEQCAITGINITRTSSNGQPVKVLTDQQKAQGRR